VSQPNDDGRDPETDPPVVLSAPRRASQTGPRLLILLVVLALAATVVVLATRNHAGHASSAVAEAAPPTSQETAAVMQLLTSHAAALQQRSAAGWSAGLDPSAASANYAARQRAVFSNLADVPLATWRYVLTAPVTDPTVLGPAAARLGGPVVVLHVELQYAFAVVDPAPTSKDLWLTAVQRSAGWLLAADDDAAAVGGMSWRGPWDYGPLLSSTSAHTLVLVHPAHRADAAVFGALVERSVPVVASVWGNAWNEHVAVLIPDTDAEFAEVSGDGGDTHDLAAVAVADSVTVDQTVLGARIVLNPDNLSRLDATGRKLVVQHELTHIASRAVTDDQMPTWLIEGFADYVGNLGSGQSVPTAAAELTTEVRAGRVPTALPTDADFDGTDNRLPQVYAEAWLACRLIASKLGQQGLVKFYKVVSTAARTDPASATSKGLQSLLHLDVAAFTASWRAYLKLELAQ
jgi:hypothetical protein